MPPADRGEPNLRVELIAVCEESWDRAGGLDVLGSSDQITVPRLPFLYRGLKVVTFHKAWDYFADAVPIELAGTIEPRPSITPSAAQVRETIERMKRDGVKVVICETYNDAKLAQYVADQAGARMVVLPDHVNGVAGTDTYAKLFRHNTERLIETAKAAGVAPKSAEGRARDAR